MDNRVDNSALVNEIEKRLREFVEVSSDWFWGMDEQCRFSYFSDWFTEVHASEVDIVELTDVLLSNLVVL